LVEAHGGRIEVSSHLGEGTVFSVVLPMEASGSQLPDGRAV
jgi:signal transduction histidine kinase